MFALCGVCWKHNFNIGLKTHKTSNFPDSRKKTNGFSSCNRLITPTFPPQEKPIGPNLFLTLIITHLIDDSPHWFAVRFHRTPGDNHLIKSLELATHLYLVVVRCHPGWEPVIILCSPDWPGLASFKVITIIIIIVTTLKLGESFTPRPTSRGRGWSHQELN